MKEYRISANTTDEQWLEFPLIFSSGNTAYGKLGMHWKTQLQ